MKEAPAGQVGGQLCQHGPKAPETSQSHCGARKGPCTDPPGGPLLQGWRCYILPATAPQTGQPQPQQSPPCWDGVSGPDSSRTRPELLHRQPCALRSPAHPAPLPKSEQSSNETEPTGTFPKPGAVRSNADMTQVGVRGKPDGPRRLRCSSPAAVQRGPVRPREGPEPAALCVQPRVRLCAQREKDFTAKDKQRSMSSRDTSKGTILRGQRGARGIFFACFRCAAAEAAVHLSARETFFPFFFFPFFTLPLEKGEDKFVQM